LRITLLALGLMAAPAATYLQFDPEFLVQAGGTDLDVPGLSIPDLWDWNEDGLLDLVVGEGGSVYAGKLRVYLNQGSAQAPLYEGFFYVQSASGGDLSYTPG